MAEIKQIQISGTTYDIHAKLADQTEIGYGTCSTAAATAAKIVTIADTNWVLKTGSIIGVKFTEANSASSITLNVNNTGAKSIAYSTNAPYTGSTTTYTGTANRVIYYMYDGTYWRWISIDGSVNSDTIPSAHCTTAAATAAKTASFTYYTATANRYLQVNIRYANTKAGALTLNINSTGAKPIYINGSASSASNYTLPAGSYIVYYNGTNYYFRTDGTIPTSTGAAGQLTDTTYSAATTSAAGLMSASDKTKLDGIATGATANTGTVTSVATSGAITGGTITTSGTISHSTAAGYKHIPSGGAANQALVYDSNGTAKWQNIITFVKWGSGD